MPSRTSTGNGVEVDHDAARRVVIKTGVSMGGMVYVIIAGGGGIFALRRPRPYSRHCGEGVAMHAASTIFTPHRHQWEGVEADHDAARRVATSFEKRENRF